jgi:hypothetical protein
MDKNKFWLGGRLFNSASPRLVAPTKRKACPQVGRPNATQGTFGSWVPQRTSAKKTQGTSAHPQVGRPNATQGTSASWAPKRNTRRVRKMGAQTKNSSATKTSTQESTRQRKMHVCKMGPKRNTRHVGKLEVDNAMQCTSASWAPQRMSATQTQGTCTSASWAPQRNERHVRKMVAQTQNSSATKTSTQGSTRLKDELEDG